MSEIICGECGEKQDDSFRYCKNCGLPLQGEPAGDGFKNCPECGARNPEISKFCANCGSSFEDDSMKCSACGCRLNDEEFCPECGKPTGIKVCPKCMHKSVNENFCPSCGLQFNPDVKKCPECGAEMDVNSAVCTSCGFQIVRKSALFAVFLSFIFPGVGQFYNGQNRKAIILIVAYIISLVLCLLIVGFVLVFIIWIYGMYDAYVSAKAISDGEHVPDSVFGL